MEDALFPGSDPGANERVIRKRISRRSLIAGMAASSLALHGAQVVRAQDELDEFVTSLMRALTLRERIAQLFIFQAYGTYMTPYFQKMLTDVKPGGIIFVQPNISNHDTVKKFVAAIHGSNSMLPPFLAIDQEGGNVIRLPGDPSLGAPALGKLSDKDVRASARRRAWFLKDYGFDVNFAPVADVAYATNSTMYLRSFGADPTVVAEKVASVVQGSRQVKSLGAAKHFPGHGRTNIDSHYSIPTVDISKKDWKKTDALPFESAVKAGVEMVMVGHLKYPQWDDQPMSLSKHSVSMLRNSLAFDGLIVTDDLGMGALANINAYDVLDRAVDAGMDMLLYTVPPVPWVSLVDHLEKRVRAGNVSRKRLDSSVRRVLELKVSHFDLAPEIISGEG